MHGTRTTRHDKTIPRTSGTRAGLAGAQILLRRRPRRRGRPAATCCQGVNNRTHRVARCNTTTARKCAARTCGPGATATSSAHRAKRAWETRPLRGRRTPAAAGAPRGRPTHAMHKRGTTPSRCAGTAGGPHARAHTNDGAVTTIRGTSASCASRSPILSSATTCTTSARPCRQGVITRACTSHVHAPLQHNITVGLLVAHLEKGQAQICVAEQTSQQHTTARASNQTRDLTGCNRANLYQQNLSRPQRTCVIARRRHKRV